MTHVTLLYSTNKLVGFEAKGHTGFAQEGEDIVCSAVSALTQTAALGLTEVLGLEVALDIEEADIHCMISRELSPSDQDRAEIILKTMTVGLRSIAATYGDYIKIFEREV